MGGFGKQERQMIILQTGTKSEHSSYDDAKHREIKRKVSKGGPGEKRK